MKLRRTPRRLVSALAAVAAGIVGALVVATPAQAHHPVVSGVARCDTSTGKWIVTWTIGNSERDISGEITALTDGSGSNKTLDGVAVGDVVPAGGALSGTEIVTTKSASLTVSMEWWRNKKIDSTRTGSAQFPDQDCEPDKPVPAVDLVSDCLGVTVILNNSGRADATFVVTGSNGFSESKTVAVGDQDGETVFVPKDNASSITVTVDNQTVATGAWQDPGNCNTPVVEAASSCTEFVVKVINPSDGPTGVDGLLKPSSGSPIPFLVGQGATFEHKFTGEAGLSVLVDFDDIVFTDETVKWEPDPQQCAPPSTSTTPSLPDTGSGGLGGIIVAGAALVLGGAGLLTTLLFLRRRRSATS